MCVFFVRWPKRQRTHASPPRSASPLLPLMVRSSPFTIPFFLSIYLTHVCSHEVYCGCCYWFHFLYIKYTLMLSIVAVIYFSLFSSFFLLSTCLAHFNCFLFCLNSVHNSSYLRFGCSGLEGAAGAAASAQHGDADGGRSEHTRTR